MLFHSTIFGPVHSRRLGVSLGVNLLPDNGKICSFDCVYCECGLNADGRDDRVVPAREKVAGDLEEFLAGYIASGKPAIDSITFAGNGEPTLHKQFAEIIDDTIAIRDRIVPAAKVSVLSNAWQLKNKSVFNALSKVDNNILKLDSAIPASITAINRPMNPNFDIDDLINHLAMFKHNCIIQTLFLRGETCDNTTEEEINAWLDALKKISPKEVQIYSLNRKTPYDTLRHVGIDELNAIAARVQALGLRTHVTE